MHANVGWNAAPLTELAYGRRLRLDGVERRIDLEAELAVPIFLVRQLDAFQIQPSARVSLGQIGSWGAAARLGLPVRNRRRPQLFTSSPSQHARR